MDELKCNCVLKSVFCFGIGWTLFCRPRSMQEDVASLAADKRKLTAKLLHLQVHFLHLRVDFAFSVATRSCKIVASTEFAIPV
jgi:hypothetical protein